MHSGGRREGKEILNEAELPELSPISLSGLKRVTSCSVYMSVRRWSVTWDRHATSCFSHKLDLAELEETATGVLYRRKWLAEMLLTSIRGIS